MSNDSSWKGLRLQDRDPAHRNPARLAALERGDLDINTEIWLNSVADPWERAEKTGKVKRVGELYMGGEAWYIPRYTAERLPELKSAADLPKFKDQFKDPEEPGKGRFYGCPAGWGCEVTSTNLFHALKLDDSYTLYSPGTARRKGGPDVGLQAQAERGLLLLVAHAAGRRDGPGQARHAALRRGKAQVPDVAQVRQARAQRLSRQSVFTAVNAKFAEQAPTLTEFLSKVSVPLPVMNETLAHMEESGDESAAVASGS